MKNLYYDVVIAGCGVAGLYAALNLPEEMNILMLSKKTERSCMPDRGKAGDRKRLIPKS